MSRGFGCSSNKIHSQHRSVKSICTADRIHSSFVVVVVVVISILHIASFNSAVSLKIMAHNAHKENHEREKLSR